MIAVIDYGMGNIYSIKNALNHLGAESRIVSDPGKLHNYESFKIPATEAAEAGSAKTPSFCAKSL